MRPVSCRRVLCPAVSGKSWRSTVAPMVMVSRRHCTPAGAASSAMETATVSPGASCRAEGPQATGNTAASTTARGRVTRHMAGSSRGALSPRLREGHGPDASGVALREPDLAVRAARLRDAEGLRVGCRDLELEDRPERIDPGDEVGAGFGDVSVAVEGVVDVERKGSALEVVLGDVPVDVDLPHLVRALLDEPHVHEVEAVVPGRDPPQTGARSGNGELGDHPAEGDAADLVRAALGEPQPVGGHPVDGDREGARRGDGELGDRSGVADEADLVAELLDEPVAPGGPGDDSPRSGVRRR